MRIKFTKTWVKNYDVDLPGIRFARTRRAKPSFKPLGLNNSATGKMAFPRPPLGFDSRYGHVFK
jgi:hypothetical protein